MTLKEQDRLPAMLFLLLVVATMVSFINPKDSLTWWLEAVPAIIAAGLLLYTYQRFRFSSLAYVLIFIHAIILLVGAHYTYAEVPAFDWIRDVFDLGRNHYDRVGHFAQGFVPAIVARELLLRTSPLERGKWLTTIVILVCLGISGAYELIEWITAEVSGEAAEAFLGTQGDDWDTQKDMMLALIGATAAMTLLSNIHDRGIERVALLRSN